LINAMNTQLAKSVANIIGEKWDPDKGILSSEEIYYKLIARGVQVPEGHMNEIFEEFEKAGVISGSRHKHPTGYGQHGNMIIGSVDIGLLKEFEFD
jgi:hypothetical protein